MAFCECLRCIRKKLVHATTPRWARAFAPEFMTPPSRSPNFLLPAREEEDAHRAALEFRFPLPFPLAFSSLLEVFLRLLQLRKALADWLDLSILQILAVAEHWRLRVLATMPQTVQVPAGVCTAYALACPLVVVEHGVLRRLALDGGAEVLGEVHGGVERKGLATARERACLTVVEPEVGRVAQGAPVQAAIVVPARVRPADARVPLRVVVQERKMCVGACVAAALLGDVHRRGFGGARPERGCQSGGDYAGTGTGHCRVAPLKLQ